SLDQILHELRELRLRDLLPEDLRHRVRVAGLEVGGRVDDRLLHELVEATAVRLRRLLLQLVEVGPDLAGRLRRGEGVAAAAAVLLEDGAPRRPARRAALA